MNIMRKVIKYKNFSRVFWSSSSDTIHKMSFTIRVYDKDDIKVSEEIKLKMIEEIKNM